MCADLKESLMRNNATEDCKEVEVNAATSTFGAVEQAQRGRILIKGKNSRLSARLARIAPKLRHYSVNDWVEDILR